MVTAPKKRPGLRQLLGRVFAVATLLIGVVTVGAVISFANVVNARSALINRIDPANVLAAQLLTYYVDQETGVRGYVITGQSLFLQPYESGAQNAGTTTVQLEKLLAPGSKAGMLLADVERSATSWDDQFANPAAHASVAQRSVFGSSPSLGLSKNLFDQIRAGMAALESDLAKEHHQAKATLASASDQLETVLIIAFLVIVATAAFIWVALERLIIRPLDAVGDDTEAVTTGDLTHTVESVGPREISELGQRIDAMRLRILDEVEAARSAERQLADLNDDLLRSNQDLEQFAYVASHDLQEPLRKVTSFCQLLQQRYGGQLDDRADQYIGFAVDGAKRMQVLINDLLAFSRIGRTTDHFDPIDIQGCVDAALTNLGAAIEDTGASVAVDGDLPTILGDKGLIISLMQNLIGNAIKFRGDAGPVVTIRARPGDGDWLVQVEDNGIGIEPRFADRIFVIFQRLHGRDVYAGTGIGLAMCKRIVEFHGGRIWLDTDYQGGTRFCITFPAMTPEEATPRELDRPVNAS